jgi:hypothetical protein
MTRYGSSRWPPSWTKRAGDRNRAGAARKDEACEDICRNCHTSWNEQLLSKRTLKLSFGSSPIASALGCLVGRGVDHRRHARRQGVHPASRRRETLGEVLEVDPPERIAFTYGFASGKPIPPGSSRVTIRLEPDEAGTRLHLVHEFPEAAPRDEHVQGWRFQLSLFSNTVANEVFADAASLVDAWFDAWAIMEDRLREESFARIATSRIQFRDRFSLLEGLADLTAHAGAAQRFMPGIRMERKGPVRHCQGTVLADWIAIDRDNKERMAGTNLFVFRSDGKIDAVTGFTNPNN